MPDSIRSPSVAAMIALAAALGAAAHGRGPADVRDASGTAPEGASGVVDYASEIRPLLSDRCFQCHGPDAARVEADLRLDRRDSATADRGGYAAIVAGDPEASELVYRITTAVEADRMPPAESKLELSADEVELLVRWIEEGAEVATHWAFERPGRVPPPTVAGAAWSRDPLDAFVLSRLEEVGLEPAPAADRATLLRRLSFDLTGLPPTLDELDAFLADESPDAYERAVDRLLGSTAHAERMTADWLDVARYADTFGYQSDVDMHVWPWRDWVIGAFEANLPYDDFLTWQLAGDLVPEATRESRLATTFNRLHRQTNEGGSVEEEFRLSYVADRVETMSAAFLGLTVGCAKCHDHKFDPISQRDFYALASFFDDIDESGLYSHFTASTPTPALELPTPEQEAQLADLDARIRAAEERLRSCEALPGRGAEAQGRFEFEPPDVAENAVTGEAAAQPVDRPTPVEGARGGGLELSGENAIHFPGIGVFDRSDPFSLGVRLRLPAESYERAVVVHRTKSWTDSGSRGYQMLVEEGHLTVALVHFWPGDAIAIRSREPLDTERWVHVAFTYDGSSRADGLVLYLDGVRQATEVVRDHLTRTLRGGAIEHLTIGSRFRDRGFAGGRVDDLAVYGRELSPADVAALHDVGAAPLGASDPDADAAGASLRELRAERDQLRDGVRQIMTMAVAPDLPAARRTTRLLHRGEYTAPREVVEPGLPAALPGLGLEAPRDRLDLARWLTHPDHPTTARIHVDRLWRVAFGRGLLPAPEDIGSQSPPPIHRELLDVLARDLIESGWDGRALLRRLVLSSTYRQSSTPSERALALDPGNDLLSRARRGRLPAEMIRDGALRAAGLLVDERGGPPVYPFEPPGLWHDKNGRRYPTGRGDELRRRSLYGFWRRTSPPPAMAIFDAPAREVCSVARPTTVTPQQVLALWNDPQYVEVAVALGARAVAVAGGDDAVVDHLFRSLTGQRPSEVQRRALVALLEQQRAAYRADPEAARALAGFDLERRVHPPDDGAEQAPPAEPLDDADAVERAAAAVAASTVLSLDSALTRR